MKNSLLALVFMLASVQVWAQCTTTNATACLCPNGVDTCNLYPDLKVSEQLLLEAANNPETLGELRVSVATPNIGYGPLQILATDYFVCGTDTIYSPGGMSGTCPDGTYPRQLIKQRVYRKEGNTMVQFDRWANSMTYHPTHAHMHVDDWCVFSIRTPINGVTDPLQWPVVAQGAKTGFCLMDFGSCNYYNGYCVDDNGQVMTSANQVNYGLGGGEYACGFDQGISAGFTDIYHYYLDGMGITIPEGVCNGNYYLVVVVDPDNNFVEVNDDNNVMAVPITLSEQSVEPSNLIAANGPTTFCKGESVQLQALAGDSYLWSTGQTTQTITVTDPGAYYVNVISNCYNLVSQPFEVTVLDAEIESIVPDVETVVCQPIPAILTANAEGEINWYDSPDATTPVYTGNPFVTPNIAETTTYYAQNTRVYEGLQFYNQPHDNTIGGGGLNSNIYNGHLIFDAYKEFTLQSIKVYATGEGNRTFQLRNSAGTVLQEITAMVPDGESRVTLNFEVPIGTDMQFGTAEYPSMYRNNSGVTFPYTVPGVLSIKGSNYDDPADGAYYYYYYYDWEVKEHDFICIGTPKPITINYEFCTGSGNNLSQNTFSANVVPNPSKGNFVVAIASPVASVYQLRLFDVAGKLLYDKTLGMVNGAITHTVNASNLPQGMYVLSITGGGQTYNQKVVIQ